MNEPLYDFPVSYTFRAYEAELEGITLPSIDPPRDLPEVKEPPIVRRLYWQQQVESERIDVRRKLALLFKEIDSIKAGVNRGTKKYKY
ncbi:hypothetical protein LCGC14_1342690 [marine sediment metagenome]|uniref:Uncharacterized protein n=1 Tax=marine sediment metagenome TaxID=412755 RepID=A0A0F9NFK4_9ZZZZ